MEKIEKKMRLIFGKLKSAFFKIWKLFVKYRFQLLIALSIIGLLVLEKKIFNINKYIDISRYISENNMSILKCIEEVIQNFNINYLLSFAVFTTLLSEVMNRLITSSEIKLFGLDPKPFAKYYSNVWRFRIAFVSIICAFLLKANITLFYLFVIFFIYCINVLFLNDYTRKIKDGIKKGFFLYIKKVKNDRKRYSFKIKALRDECDHLLENLIIYSIYTNDKNELIENYNTIRFNIEVFNDFYYYHLDTQSLKLFLINLKRSLNAFFIFGKKNIKTFDYYFENMLEMIFNKNQSKSIIQDNSIVITLIFIIIENNLLNESEKEKYLNMIYQRLFLKIGEENQNLFICVYFILFWKYSLDEEIDMYYIYLKDALNNVKQNTCFSNNQLYEVYKVCFHVIDGYYDYPNDIKKMFNYQFLNMVNYTGPNVYKMYKKYVEEVM